MKKNYGEIIRKCYLELLYREPDEAGFNHYLNLMENGSINESKLVDSIKNSDEYKITPRRIDLDKFDDKRDKTKIVAMYRIKNVERWIENSLKQTSKICKEIVVLDDDSTDNTLKICKNCDNVVDIHHQSNLPFDEVRDRNLLLKLALKRKPDFILTIDGDEILMPNAQEILFKEINLLYPEAPVFAFRFFHMWEKPNQYLYDPNNIKWHERLVRMKGQSPDLHFEETGFPGNLHPLSALSSNKSSVVVRSQVKILHFSCYDRTLAQEKYKFYNELDPNNIKFDRYRRILSAPDTMERRYLSEGEFIPDIM